MKALVLAVAAAGLVVSLSPGAAAQESKSGPLAKQLTAALDAAKLDSLAVRDPSNADTFYAVLYFPGVELLAVSAKYAAPAALGVKLNQHDYKNVYIDLNSASLVDSKVFIEDMGADGLAATHEENKPFDSVTNGTKPTMFDGEWKKQKLSEDEYKKAFAAADDKYSEMLTALIAQLKKTS
jgi:hypothetical protein